MAGLVELSPAFSHSSLEKNVDLRSRRPLAACVVDLSAQRLGVRRDDAAYNDLSGVIQHCLCEWRPYRLRASLSQDRDKAWEM